MLFTIPLRPFTNYFSKSTCVSPLFFLLFAFSSIMISIKNKFFIVTCSDTTESNGMKMLFNYVLLTYSDYYYDFLINHI